MEKEAVKQTILDALKKKSKSKSKFYLKDFYKILDIENDSLFEERKGESETIAGFVLELYGKFPKKKDIINLENYTFKIEAVDKKRIRRIKVTIHPDK